jgi:predicted transcriptional regulator
MAGTSPRGGGERRSAGALESEVLAALWATEDALSPAEIQDRLGGDLAYNTVHTILTRLHDKGIVVRVPLGGRTGYAPAKDAAQSAADRMRDALGAGVGRDAVLARFVTTLSAEDEAALRAALDAHRRP